ncbi:MAG: hypothetical protein M3Q24_01330 [bacterium]|nr:hypothetical protein [bacterium]
MTSSQAEEAARLGVDIENQNSFEAGKKIRQAYDSETEAIIKGLKAQKLKPGDKLLFEDGSILLYIKTGKNPGTKRPGILIKHLDRAGAAWMDPRLVKEIYKE